MYNKILNGKKSYVNRHLVSVVWFSQIYLTGVSKLVNVPQGSKNRGPLRGEVWMNELSDVP